MVLASVPLKFALVDRVTSGYVRAGSEEMMMAVLATDTAALFGAAL